MDKKTSEQRARIIVNYILCEPKMAPFMHKLHEYHETTFDHSVNVAFIATQMGIQRGLGGLVISCIENLTRGALLHDIGKIKIPKEILDKQGPLSDEEFEIIKKHPEMGYDMVKNEGFADSVLDIIRHHHEHLDGTGYPDHLRNTQITVDAQIVAVADVWDAMTSERPYKSEFPAYIVGGELNDYANIYFNNAMVRLLKECKDK